MKSTGTNWTDDLSAELYYVIQQYLAHGPCKRSAEVLRREIEEHQLLSKRVDFLGDVHKSSFIEFERNLAVPVDPNQIKNLCIRLGQLLGSPSSAVSQALVSKVSLLTSGSHSLLKNHHEKLKSGTISLTKLFNSRHLRQREILQIPNILTARRIAGRHLKSIAHANFLPDRIELQTRIFGHLSSVFCVTFDKTGRYLVTGADDNLLKLWSVDEGRLIYTFRGFSGEITDISINSENTLIAGASCDKTVRVWRLTNAEPVAVLQGHSALVTTLQFLPLVDGDDRWMISTSNDCCVCFWKYNVTTNCFIMDPIKYAERMRVGGQMISSTYSPGGRFVVTGGSDCYVRIYILRDGIVERLFEEAVHTDRVGTIQWSHKGLRFISGSRDGVAKIWTFSRQKWNFKCLIMDKRYESRIGFVPVAVNDPKNLKLRITMVAWTGDDSLVVTAVSDSTLRVWDGSTGNFLRYLLGHTDDVYVLEPHPVNYNILLSAGHDGNLILWDVCSGKTIKKHFNDCEDNGHGAFFDAKFSQDGDRLAATDSHGHLLIFGAESNQALRTAVPEQFFHTDYRPLVRDSNQYVIDEQMQLAPHLMPPPFLVDSDGNPHPPILQRRVPGRERCSEANLLPIIIRHASENEHAVIADPNSVNGVSVPQGDNDDVVNHVPNSRLFSVWTSRCLVRPLLQDLIDLDVKTRRVLGIEEYEEYKEELAKPQLPERTPVTPETDTEKQKNRRRNVPSRAVNQNRPEVAPLEPKVVIYYETDESDETYSTDLNSSSEESSSETASVYSSPTASTYSTTVNGIGVEPESENKSRIKKTRPKKTVQEKPHSSASPPRRKSRRTRTQVSNGFVDKCEEKFDESGPSTSSAASKTEKRKKIKPTCVTKSAKTDQSKEKPSRSGLPVGPKTLVDVPNHFLFPDWMTSSVPRKSPYFPQIHDEVVYFPHGHCMYVDEVTNLGLYQINHSSLPFNRHEFQDQEFAIVVSVRFEIQPVRLCCLKLAQINPRTRKRTGLTYTVRYHDVPNVIDFIVLRQHYVDSLARRWKPGDSFRTIIEDKWFFGKVIKKCPLEPSNPQSNFLCFVIQWENGDEERLSPWDLEIVPDQKMPVKKGSVVLVTPEELLHLASYDPQPGDWPSGHHQVGTSSSGSGDRFLLQNWHQERERQIGRLCAGLQRLSQFSVAEPFVAPVDLNAYPTYCLYVEYPVDLSTIRSRLDNCYYRRIEAVEMDIKQLLRNAMKFNEPRSQIVKNAKIVCNVLLKFIEDPDCDDIVAVYNEVTGKDSKDIHITHSSNNSFNGGVRVLRRYEIEDESETSDPINNWINECKEVLTIVSDADNSNRSALALSGQDSEQSSNADDVASTFSLKSLFDRLDAEQYESPQVFHDDLISWFDSNKVDRTNKRSKAYLNMLRVKGRVQQMLKPILDSWRLKNVNLNSNATLGRSYNMRNRKSIAHQTYVSDHDLEESNKTSSQDQPTQRTSSTSRTSNSEGEQNSQTDFSMLLPISSSDARSQRSADLLIKKDSTRSIHAKNCVVVSQSEDDEKPSTSSTNVLTSLRQSECKQPTLFVSRKIRRLNSPSSDEENENRSMVTNDRERHSGIRLRIKKETVIKDGSRSSAHLLGRLTRFGGKRTIQYAERSDSAESDDENGISRSSLTNRRKIIPETSSANGSSSLSRVEILRSPEPPVVLSTSSRGRVCKLRRYNAS